MAEIKTVKAICRQRCYVPSHTSLCKIWYPGQITEFKEDDVCIHFEPLTDSHKVNFLTASEEELMATKWSLSEAKAVIKERYDVDIKADPGDSKASVVERILDARYRSRE